MDISTKIDNIGGEQIQLSFLHVTTVLIAHATATHHKMPRSLVVAASLISLCHLLVTRARCLHTGSGLHRCWWSLASVRWVTDKSRRWTPRHLTLDCWIYLISTIYPAISHSALLHRTPRRNSPVPGLGCSPRSGSSTRHNLLHNVFLFHRSAFIHSLSIIYLEKYLLSIFNYTSWKRLYYIYFLKKGKIYSFLKSSSGMTSNSVLWLTPRW